jgi:hypothetical protein
MTCPGIGELIAGDLVESWCGSTMSSETGTTDEGAMSLLLILIILLLVFGGGGMFLGGPRTGISLGGLILIVIVFMAVTGRL